MAVSQSGVDPSKLDGALEGIASAMAKIDPEGAFRLAAGIHTPEHRIGALVAVAQQASKAERDLAMKALNDSLALRDTVADPYERAELRDSIAFAMARVGIPKGITLYRESQKAPQPPPQPGYYRTPYQARIYFLAVDDINAAVAMAQAMADFNHRERSLYDISWIAARTDVNVAFDVALKIVDPALRDGAYLRIASDVGERDPAAAVAAFRRISDFKDDGAHYVAYLSYLSRTDLPQAMSVLEKYKGRPGYYNAFMMVNTELSKSNPEEAVRREHELKDSEFKSSLLAETAAIIARSSPSRSQGIFDEALAEARKMRERGSQAYSLLDVAVKMAKSEPKEALTVYDEAFALFQATPPLSVWDQIGELISSWFKSSKQVGSGPDGKEDPNIKKADALMLWGMSAMKVDRGRALDVFEEALATAEKCPDKSRKYGKIGEILGEVGQIDFARAMKYIAGIEDEWQRDESYRDLAGRLAAHDPENALKAAYMLPSCYPFRYVFTENLDDWGTHAPGATLEALDHAMSLCDDDPAVASAYWDLYVKFIEKIR